MARQPRLRLGEYQEYLPLGVPWRGINYDTPAHQLPADQSTKVQNFITGTAGVLTARRGFRGLKAWYYAGGNLAQQRPVCILPLLNGTSYHVLTVTRANNKFAGTFPLRPPGGTPSTFVSFYQAWTPLNGAGLVPSGYSDTDFEALARNWSATGVLSSATTFQYDMTVWPDSKPDSYEGQWYWASGGRIPSRLTKNGTTVNPAAAVVQWGGGDITMGIVGDHANTVTINNGATTGTFGAAPAGLTFNGCYLHVNVENTGFSYNYKIISHATSATAFTISEPYGLGESTTNVANKAGAACTVRAAGYIVNSPVDCAVVINHLDRLFAGRGQLQAAVGSLQPGIYPNMIRWSEPGQPQKWPDTNTIIVGGEPDDMIMAFGKVGQALLIFKRKRTYIMTGDSETNFSVRIFSNNIGCIDSRSVVNWNENLIWADTNGVYMLGPDLNLTVLTTDKRTGGGIRRLWRRQFQVGGLTLEGVQTMTTAAVFNDHLLIQVVDYSNFYSAIGTGSSFDTLVLNLKSMTWSTFKYGEAVHYLTSTRVNRGNGLFLGTLTTFAAGDNMFVTNPTYDIEDNSVATSFSDVSKGNLDVDSPVKIQAIFDTREIVPEPTNTVSVKELYVHHNYAYAKSTTAAGGQVLTTVKIAWDNNMGASNTVGTFQPRRIANAFTGLGADPLNEGYYIDRVVDGAGVHQLPTNVHSFRVELDSGNLAAPTAVTDDNLSYRIYDVVAVIERGREGYEQTKVT